MSDDWSTYKAERAAKSTRRKAKICDAKWALRPLVNLDADFHALSSHDVDLINQAARRAGYRKSKNAPGSRARMFFQYLQRTRCW